MMTTGGDPGHWQGVIRFQNRRQVSHFWMKRIDDTKLPRAVHKSLGHSVT